MSAVKSTERYAMLVVVEASDEDEAYESVGDALDIAQYASGPWEVVECDGSYDFDSVLAQKFEGAER